MPAGNWNLAVSAFNHTAQTVNRTAVSQQNTLTS
jgi:hypothetical protein